MLKSFDISKALSHFSNKLVTVSQSIMSLVKLHILRDSRFTEASARSCFNLAVSGALVS